MNCQHPPAQSYQSWIDEHDSLQAIMQSVRETMAEPTRPAGEISALIIELAEVVRAHFENEEAGGYFADVLAEAPRFAQRVEALVQQHGQLLRLLEQLRKRVIAGARSQASWLEARALFEQFLHDFQEHESAEQRLMQEACTDELGAGD